MCVIATLMTLTESQIAAAAYEGMRKMPWGVTAMSTGMSCGSCGTDSSSSCENTNAHSGRVIAARARS